MLGRKGRKEEEDGKNKARCYQNLSKAPNALGAGREFSRQDRSHATEIGIHWEGHDSGGIQIFQVRLGCEKTEDRVHIHQRDRDQKQ